MPIHFGTFFFSLYCTSNLKLGSPQFGFYEFNVNNTIKLRAVFDKHPFDMVFHLVANAVVNKVEESAVIDIENSLQTTLSVLAMIRIHEIKKFFFASSSTVYSNAEEHLQEHHSIMRPISHYGAVKPLLAHTAACTTSKFG